MKKQITLALTLLLVSTLACSLQNAASPTSQPTGGGLPGTPTEVATPRASATATLDANPVSLNTGFASLNSYILTVNFISAGPGPKQSSTLTMVTQRSKDPDAVFIHYSSVIVDDKGKTTNGSSDTYRIGNDQCSGSEDDWTWTSLSANETEMLDLLREMIGLTPLIDNPTFLAAETMNGIPSNHFTFRVSGLGVTSGAEVTANQGEYWLAIDGQYIVKYSLVLETRESPDTNVLHEEIHIELTNVNQPVNIAFTPTCLDAKNNNP